MTRKHFLYTIAESRRDRNGNSTRQIRLYRVVRGMPVFLGRYNYTFESDAQACYNAMEALNVLPKKVWAECMHVNGGRDHTKLEKFCTIHNLSHTEVERSYR